MGTLTTGGITFTTTCVAVNPLETEEYQLDRRATALRKAGDWDGAIDALRRRKELMGEQWADDKLAKYLQRAGRFDEAMAEIAWLVEHAQAWAAWGFAHQPASVLQRQRAGYLARVHGAAMLICKREARADLLAHHQARRDAYAALRERLKPVADADRRRLAQRWEAARQEGRASISALIDERRARIERNQIEQPTGGVER